MQARVKPDACRKSRRSEREGYDFDQHQAKASLAKQIAEVLYTNNYTQLSAAEALGIDQPKVSRLLNGRLAEFSTERLLRFLTLLGNDVEIIVRRPTTPDQRQTGRLRVIGNG